MSDREERLSRAVPVRVTALDHFVLRVQDLERSLAFYHGALGLEVHFLEEFRAGRRPFVSVRAGEQLLDLVPDPTFAPAKRDEHPGFLHFCVRIAGRLEDALAALEERGVTLLERTPVLRMGATGMGRSVYVHDPDGYVVELKEESA
jgi:catechol 2,3-dioxygenase-like lactoylglutathione lyase family enzyme